MVTHLSLDAEALVLHFTWADSLLLLIWIVKIRNNYSNHTYLEFFLLLQLNQRKWSHLVKVSLMLYMLCQQTLYDILFGKEIQ